MKRFLWAWSLVGIIALVGCGDGAKEAKELLSRLLQVVGIPYQVVVNICQDGNDNGICDATDLQTKITITQGESPQRIWQKFLLDENGTYLLEHYDPTKKILMEIEDNEAFHNTGQRVTLSFLPRDPKEVPIQELSILQSLIDNGLMQADEIKPLVESDVRPLVDRVLLENIFQNQTILEEHNMSQSDATIRNLEYISEGLRDINISGNFVHKLEACENNNSCQTILLQDANEQTEINKQEAEIIAETNSTEGTGDRSTLLTVEEEESNTTTEEDNNTSTTTDSGIEENNSTSTYEPISTTESTEKQATDGYIIKLNSLAVATCGEVSYNSLSTVGAKGLITFSGVILGGECIITIPSGSTIDANNNGVLDSEDKVLSFEMRGSSDGSFISPLTTLVLDKEANGEDVSDLKGMVKDFNPVNSGSSESDKKLMLLMELTKELLKSNQSLSLLSIGDILDSNKSLEDINVSTLMASFPSSVNSVISENVNVKKSLLMLFEDIDQSKIDLATLFVNISDGGKNLQGAIESAKKTTLDTGNLFASILIDSNQEALLVPELEEIDFLLTQQQTALQKAIAIFENLQSEDDIQEEIERAKLILTLADTEERDAKVGLALISLAEITNNSELSSLINVSLNSNSNLSTNFSTIIKGLLDDDLNIKLENNTLDPEGDTKIVIEETINKLGDINQTLADAFDDSTYLFNYNDTNISAEESKIIRSEILGVMAQLEYNLAFKYIDLDLLKNKTMEYNGQTVEYTEFDSNPIVAVRDPDVGDIDNSAKLTHAKALFLEGLSLYESIDISTFDPQDQPAIQENQQEAVNLRKSILGEALYVNEENISNYSEKLFFNLANLFDFSTALTLDNFFGHEFNYKPSASYVVDPSSFPYVSGEYNQTLSQYYNTAVSAYWIDPITQTRIEANESTGLAELELNATNIPIGDTSNYSKILSKVEIYENNALKYSFSGDDVLRWNFNEFKILTKNFNNDHYTSSSDVNITHTIASEIAIPYTNTLSYNIYLSGQPEWINITNIDDKTLHVTVDDNTTNVYGCYVVEIEVNGKIKNNSYCINIYEN